MSPSDDSTSRDNEVNQKVMDLLESAHKTGLNGGGEVNLPRWINPDALEAGKEFVKRHFFLIFFTHFISLVLLLSYLPVRIVLLKTKRSHTKSLALTRYLSTLLHVKLWYEGDMSSLNGSAAKDVIKVGKIHSGVYHRLQEGPNWNGSKSHAPQVTLSSSKENEINKLIELVRKCGGNSVDKNNNISKPNEPSPHIISQFDMVVTQYCFMGLISSFPQKFGVKESKGLQGFVHLWAVIGHLLGIEDRFNLCIGEKSNLKHFILHETLARDFARTDSNTFILWDALVGSMSTFVPYLSLHAALTFILSQILEVQTKSLSEFTKQGTFYDIFCYKLTLFLILNFFRFNSARNTFNYLLRIAIYTTNIKLQWQKKINKIISYKNN